MMLWDGGKWRSNNPRQSAVLQHFWNMELNYANRGLRPNHPDYWISLWTLSNRVRGEPGLHGDGLYVCVCMCGHVDYLCFSVNLDDYVEMETLHVSSVPHWTTCRFQLAWHDAYNRCETSPRGNIYIKIMQDSTKFQWLIQILEYMYSNGPPSCPVRLCFFSLTSHCSHCVM